MKIVNNLELVHMAEIHSQARASSQYGLVQNSFRHSFNNILYSYYYHYYYYYYNILCNVLTLNFRMLESIIESMSE